MCYPAGRHRSTNPGRLRGRTTSAALARSPSSPVAAMGDPRRRWYGLQFHPEVRHTPRGDEVIRAFVLEVCGARPEWTPESIISQTVADVRAKVGEGARG